MSGDTGVRRLPAMTPDQIRGFPLPTTTLRRGYAQDRVDDLLSRLAAEAAARDATIATLAAENARLGNLEYARRHGQVPVAVGFDEHRIEAMVGAQQHAEQIIAAAQNNAVRVVHESRAQAAEILRGAREAADRAARQYRAEAGPEYTAAAEQLVRIRTWVLCMLQQLGGLRHQVDATHAAADAELMAILELLDPLLPARQPTPTHPPA